MAYDTAQTPNQAAMTAAVTRWISEASGRPNGGELLRAKADWVEQRIRDLSRSASKDEQPPKHLVGLTAFDLIECQLKLNSAAGALIEGVAQ